MLARRAGRAGPFSRRDARRLLIAAGLLVAALAAVLSIDIIPSGIQMAVGEVAGADVAAPREASFTSEVETAARRAEARDRVPPQYDYTPEKGQATAAQQVGAFEEAMRPVDAAFTAILSEDSRRAALAQALPYLSRGALGTLQSLDAAAWASLRTEMNRVLESAQVQEVRDTVLPAARASLGNRIALRFPAEQRALAGEILSPLLVANSTYDPARTMAAQQEAANAVEPATSTIKRGELLVRKGDRITERDVEELNFFGLGQPRPDPGKLAGWVLFSILVVGLLLTWLWRFRPNLWNRNNALLLVGLLVVLSAVAVKATAERSVLPYLLPLAAAGLLLAVLLDSTTAFVVMAVLGVLSSVATGSVEFGAYVLLGGFAGVVAVRRGERIGHFFQAAVAIALVNVAVVTVFTLLGDRDPQAVLELWGASILAAGGAAVAAVGSFALLGDLFGITTSFQLLELGNPSQPLLRRLLLETPGTYHHSIMVGNLGERAAEAIGADPLITRVAAYYHDIGKLANPLAFIENQAGMENIHDQLTPERSAEVLKAHVANGIDLAYQYRLAKAVIPFIPQHHGTALMSYFHARAKDRAIAAAGAIPGTPGAHAAAASVDPARFRHSGPKPQSREAAILMLADSVEASVRSLTSHEEPAIRAMVARIIRERADDGQFDECDLTLRDLDRIRDAFVAQLLGMYHRRIQYPLNKIVELESRRAATR